MALDRFYLIVDDVRWLERLLPHGVRLAQLRVKDRPQVELRAQVRRARDLCAAAGAQLVVNDYWRLAIEEGCDFGHLGQEDLSQADVGAIKKAGLRLGLSSHDHAELEMALASEPDYVALGPIFPTILKKMKWGPQGLDRVAEWKKRVSGLPLVAIGGLTPERLEGVFGSGADSAAVVTDILLNPDPEARTREWIAATEPWR
jgi:thiamine-phosphate pyrophosphorylase